MPFSGRPVAGFPRHGLILTGRYCLGMMLKGATALGAVELGGDAFPEHPVKSSAATAPQTVADNKRIAENLGPTIT